MHTSTPPLSQTQQSACEKRTEIEPLCRTPNNNIKIKIVVNNINLIAAQLALDLTIPEQTDQRPL